MKNDIKGKKQIAAVIIVVLVFALFFTRFSSIMTSIAVSERVQKDDVKSAYREVKKEFDTEKYYDKETDMYITYGIYVPEDYDKNTNYPMVTFIGDTGCVGSEVIKSLSAGLGGSIWATEAEQEKHPCFVLIPQYSEEVINSTEGTKTDYIDATERMIESVCEDYSIDTSRIYATGQDMGCSAQLYLAANYPDLYAAEIFVADKWNIDELKGLENETFLYAASAGDGLGSAGQEDVENMLKADGISYNELTDLDAGADNNTSVEELLAQGGQYNFITYEKGTMLPWYVTKKTSEHLFTFDYVYRMESVRDWLFEQ